MTENNSNLLIGWKQIAAYLRCASSTARRQARDKGLPVFRVGGSVRAHVADIDRWLEAQPRPESAPGAGAAPQALIVGGDELPTAVSNLGGRAAGHRYAVFPLGVEEEEFARIQQLLRSAEEKYQRLVEQVPAWIWETNAAGEFTYSNPRSRQILGYDPGDFAGFAPTEFAVAPEDAESFGRSFGAVRRRGSVMKGFRCRFAHRDGSRRWLETDAEPAFDAAGEFAGVRGVSRDVTEAVQAEAARQETHERLTATLNALPDLLFEVDRNGLLYDFRAPDPDLLFARPEDFLGREIGEFLPSEAARVVREALAEAAETGSHSGGQYQLEISGGVHWFELSISSRGDHRNPECRFIMLVRDITERKQAETELRVHRDRLEELVEERTAELREVNAGLEREIADRARAEKELEEQRNRLQTITTVTPDLLVLLDRDFVYRAVNPAFCHFIGKREEELIGRTDFDVFPQAAAEVYRRSDEEVVASGELHILEREAADADGTTWWLQVAKAPIFDAAGEVSGLLVSARDITERRRAEEALRESEGLYRELVETSPDSISFVDLEGTVLAFNRQGAAMVGVDDPRDIVGRSLLEFIARDEDREAAAADVQRVVTEGTAMNVSYDLRRADGSIFPTESSASLVRGADGEPKGLILVTRDVTERRRAEEKLRMEMEFSENILNTAVDTIFVFDPQTGKPLRWNKAFSRVSGYSDEEIAAKVAPDDWYSPEDLQKAAATTEEIFAEGSGIVEMSLIAKDGKTIPTEYVGSLVKDAEGNPQYIISVGRDITERRLAEEALRESEEKFRNLAEQSPNMIFINSRGKVVYANKECEEVMGYTREEFRAPDFEFLTLIAPASQESVRRAFVAHSRGEDVEPYEYTLVTKDARRIEAIITTKLMTYEGERAILGIVTDVTERKRAEAALRESEEKYRDLFENANDLIQSVTPEGRFLYVNPAWKETLGFDDDEIPELNLFDIIHPASRPRCRELFERVLAGERLDNVETVFVTKDGREVVVEGSASCRFEEERPVSTRGVFRDVTERKRAEEALRESEKRYRLLADNASDVILTMDLSLRFTYISPSVTPLLGYSAEEMTAFTLKKISTPASFKVAAKTLAEEIAREMAGTSDMKRSRTVDLELIRKDGSPVWVEAKAIFLRDPNDKAIGILAVARDVTARRQAERAIKYHTEALRESEERLKLATEAGDLGLWDCNVVAEELIFDDRYASQLGYEAAEFEPHVKTWRELVHPEDLQSVLDVIEKHLAGKTPEYEIEYRMRTKAGGWKWILDRGKVVARDDSGRALRAAGTHQDVTARKEAQERLRASEERYRALFELSPEAVIVLDPQGTVLDVNVNGYAWFGLRREDIVGKKFEVFPFVPDDVKEKTMAAFARRLAGEDVPPYELDVNTPDGGKWRLRVRGEILRNEKGEVVADLVMVSRVPLPEETTG